jgi:4-hydroxy-2-oxoheptanedioate aldolase
MRVGQRENTAKAKWRAGEVTYGAWLGIPSMLSAEALAHAGYDWLCIDMQHGAIDYSAAYSMLTAIGTTAAVPLVRVPYGDFSTIQRVLDAGALGVIVPMVNTVDEARAAVNACRYAPHGTRSWGPVRAQYALGGNYFERADDQIACIVMIETKQALDRIDDILAVPGIDAVYVGPADLSITLGLPPGLDNGGAFEEARLRIAEACRAHGVTAGMHANASLAAKHAAAGYRMITITHDLGALNAAAATDLRHARGGGVDRADAKGPYG